MSAPHYRTCIEIFISNPIFTSVPAGCIPGQAPNNSGESLLKHKGSQHPSRIIFYINNITVMYYLIRSSSSSK